MFKGLQQKFSQGTPPVGGKKNPEVVLIQSAATLLGSEKLQPHLKNIKSLLNLPPKFYNRLYYQVIEQFAEFVQTLPETVHGTFANDGGFLEHGIERAARALSLCLAYFFPEEKSLNNMTPTQALWIYAVFTAALLLDIGKLAVKYKITLCQKDGTPIKDWHPYSASMVAQGKHYRYDFVKENRDNLRRLITSLLARQILTEATHIRDESENAIYEHENGFNWIASDPNVLEAWLALLSGEGRPMSSFMTMIPLADAQVIENHIKNLKTPGTPSTAGGGLFIGTIPTEDAMFSSTIATGEAFLQWLRNALIAGTVSVNQTNSHLQITQDGILISPEIFKEFAIENIHYKNPEVVEQQFRKFVELSQVSAGELGRRYSHVQGVYSVEMQKHLLITNPFLLYATGQIPAVNPNIIKLPATPTESNEATPTLPKNSNVPLQHR